MRILLIFLLVVSSATWGEVQPKNAADTVHVGGGNSPGIFYWKVGLQRTAKLVLSSSADRTVIFLRDLQSGNTLQNWKHATAVWKAAISPDAQLVLVELENGIVFLRDVQSDNVFQTWKHDGLAWDVTFSPDGQLVMAGFYDGTAVLRDVQSGKMLQTWKHGDSVSSVAISPDGQLALTGSADGIAVLRDVQSGKTLQTWKHSDSVFNATFSPDGRKLLIISLGGNAVLRDVQSGKTLQTWKHDDSVLSVAISPDGQLALTGLKNGSVDLRDLQSGNTLQKWKHEDSVQLDEPGFKVSDAEIKAFYDQNIERYKTSEQRRASHILINASKDASAAVKAAAKAKAEKILEQVRKNPTDFAKLAKKNSQDTVSAERGGDLKFFGRGEFVIPIEDVVFSLKEGEISDLVQSDFGFHIILVTGIKATGIRELANVKEDIVKEITRQRSDKKYAEMVKKPVSIVAFSPDGRQLLTGTLKAGTYEWGSAEDWGTVVIKDLQSGKTLKTWKHNGIALLFSSDARIGLESALNREIAKAKAEYQSLPQSLASRQSKIEREKPTKDEFESVAQFKQRTPKWHAAAEALNTDIQAHYVKLGPLPLDKRTKAFERALSRAYGNPELHDIRYDPETAQFFVTLKASLNPEFKRLVSIAVPNDQARAAQAKLTSIDNGLQVELRVTEQNELKPIVN
jgi:WD40 repeat protein